MKLNRSFLSDAAILVVLVGIVGIGNNSAADGFGLMKSWWTVQTAVVDIWMAPVLASLGCQEVVANFVAENLRIADGSDDGKFVVVVVATADEAAHQFDAILRPMETRKSSHQLF
jgi:hypothetical protein